MRLTSSRKTCSFRRSTRKDRRTLQSPNQMETALSGYGRSSPGAAGPAHLVRAVPSAGRSLKHPSLWKGAGQGGWGTAPGTLLRRRDRLVWTQPVGWARHTSEYVSLSLCVSEKTPKTRYARDASAHLYLLTSSPSGPGVLGQKGPARPLREDHTPLSPFPPPLAGRMDNRSPYPAEVTRNEASLVSCLSYSFLIRGCPHLPMSVPGRRRSRCSAHTRLYTGPQGVGHRSNSNFSQS